MVNHAIEMIQINKTYHEKDKSVQALKDFSMKVPKGAFVSIMGGSGCGKSTVTKIIAGIEPHDSGRLVIDGNEIAQRHIPPALKKRIGYVFQWHNLAQWRSVEKNLYFPLEMFGERKDASWEKRADKYLELVGLTKYRHIFPKELSGGMKQRVGIARALMMEPDILVFDQPFGALDAMTRSALAEALSDLVRKENKTMIMVTSDLDEAVHYSDYIHVMQGPPGNIINSIETGITQEQRNQADFRTQASTLEIKLQLTHAIYGENA